MLGKHVRLVDGRPSCADTEKRANISCNTVLGVKQAEQFHELREKTCIWKRNAGRITECDPHKEGLEPLLELRPCGHRVPNQCAESQAAAMAQTGCADGIIVGKEITHRIANRIQATNGLVIRI